MCEECEREEYQQYINTEVENANQTNEQIIQEMLFEKVKTLNQEVKEKTSEVNSKELKIKYLEQKIQDLEKTLETKTWDNKNDKY
tara:strand:+ start:149 stop:403 length:255 start_codon:yes stop_codon:yes gene_type:complete